MSKLFRPDRPDALIEEALRGPSQDTTAIINQLGSLLAGITRQLDLLIRLECGALKRADLRASIQAAEAQARALTDVTEEVPAGAEGDPATE